MKCARNPDALSMCRATRDGLDKNWILWASRICPRPQTDPDLICQVGKWYLDKGHPQEVAMDGIDNFDTFMGGEFNLDLEELLLESYNYYEQHGVSGYSPDKLELGVGNAIGLRFHLPTCQSERMAITNFKYRSHSEKKRFDFGAKWQFPASCGDYRSNETAIFQSQIGFDPESGVFKSTDIGKTYKDMIPRVSPQSGSTVSL